ncbi:hypothetical protein [Bradyrhizobium cenepequi]|uniref:hypothetical protein n=1 Tax=Bradyrhizobium cenepequi TaxID=2821403 RepID=UPI001CE29CAE|nr:hypothetical protein [Bradyrhizobium cenepequi]MCA6108161.1 hypothetical protein [Bradyrhizobium cenepequi]
MEQERKHFFRVSGETVVTGIVPIAGGYAAVLADDRDGLKGFGCTRLSAITDLSERLDVLRQDGEEMRDEPDHAAAHHDHTRDLRKHATAGV